MVLDGLRGYLQLANGLSEVTRERALAAARALSAQGEAGVGAVVPPPVRSQVSALTEELLATSKGNRDQLVELVRGEVERYAGRLGFASAHELDAANRRVKGLERRVAELEEELRTSTTARKAANTRARKASAKKVGARKTAAKRSTARRTPASDTGTGATTASDTGTGATTASDTGTGATTASDTGTGATTATDTGTGATTATDTGTGTTTT